ncbi:hypothetical protein BDV96DRAFT_584834 [Lophiotrema nucula]|uniref:Secreted protein n=1 Tax=Lophiotrema nucula TaxID=690887 RepID=A0A6A5YSH7_9PLEO|nr:hypothetical protein BDV96DRAFT_584834 [Lophiotrema nucula]
MYTIFWLLMNSLLAVLPIAFKKVSILHCLSLICPPMRFSATGRPSKSCANCKAAFCSESVYFSRSTVMSRKWRPSCSEKRGISRPLAAGSVARTLFRDVIIMEPGHLEPTVGPDKCRSLGSSTLSKMTSLEHRSFGAIPSRVFSFPPQRLVQLHQAVQERVQRVTLNLSL